MCICMYVWLSSYWVHVFGLFCLFFFMTMWPKKTRLSVFFFLLLMLSYWQYTAKAERIGTFFYRSQSFQCFSFNMIWKATFHMRSSHSQKYIYLQSKETKRLDHQENKCVWLSYHDKKHTVSHRTLKILDSNSFRTGNKHEAAWKISI